MKDKQLRYNLTDNTCSFKARYESENVYRYNVNESDILRIMRLSKLYHTRYYHVFYFNEDVILISRKG